MNQSTVNAILLLVFCFIGVIFTYNLYEHFFKNTKKYNVIKFMTRVGIFGAMATILYVTPYFKLKLPLFPSFLEFHFDEIPAFICGFAYGPISGFCVLLIKTLIKLPASTTATVGEFSDLLLSSIYVCITCFVYQKKRNLIGVLIGFLIGTIIQIVAAMVFNVYVLIPFYMQFMGLSRTDLLNAMRLAIPGISDIEWGYANLAVLPFNALKDAIVIAITFVVYRSIHFFLRFEKKNS